MMKAPLFLGVVAVLLCLSGPVFAQGGPVITVDENGNAIGAMSLGIQMDPNGGVSTLAYQLPFAGTKGDVGLSETAGTLTFSDLLRFTGDGRLFFYSDFSTADPANSLADVGRPGVLLTNGLPLVETGPEGGINGVFNYTPMSSQPGFDSSHPTYNFISDGSVVPEPGSLTLLGIGALGLAGYAWRRRKQAA